MSVLKVTAAIECDGCGKHFLVDVDTGRTVPEGWSVFDIAEDAVRGGHVVAKPGESVFDSMAGSSSVQDGKMLCIPCTRAADAAGDDDDALADACEAETAP